MKIRLEIPKARELPSQGRNSGSIPDGGTTDFEYAIISSALDRFSGFRLTAGRHYRAWLDPDKTDAEFVFFVGWTSANCTMVFEDADGDLHVCSPDEVDTV